MTSSGVATLKAPRRIPDTVANPDGATMRRFEWQFETALTSTLADTRRQLASSGSGPVGLGAGSASTTLGGLGLGLGAWSGVVG